MPEVYRWLIAYCVHVFRLKSLLCSSKGKYLQIFRWTSSLFIWITELSCLFFQFALLGHLSLLCCSLRLTTSSPCCEIDLQWLTQRHFRSVGIMCRQLQTHPPHQCQFYNGNLQKKPFCLTVEEKNRQARIYNPCLLLRGSS